MDVTNTIQRFLEKNSVQKSYSILLLLLFYYHYHYQLTIFNYLWGKIFYQTKQILMETFINRSASLLHMPG